MTNFLWNFKQFIISIDQTVNALTGGWADETISSRMYRTQSPFVRVIDTLFFFDKDHCKRAFESERERLQLPPEMRSIPNGDN